MAVSRAIWEVARPAAELGEDWSAPEMARRAVKQLYRAGQALALLALPWERAAQQFVELAMQGYSSACGDEPWFFELDLGSALVAGAWELAQAGGMQPPGGFAELERAVMAQYEELMDATLLDKAMWSSTSAVLGDGPVGLKVYKFVSAAYEAAFQEACADTRPLRDLRRVEAFVRTWMEGSMGRAWQALDNARELLSVENVVRLFQHLVAPFGEDHPFSCVPTALTQSIGRPPRNWLFLHQLARQLFEETWGLAAAHACLNADGGAGCLRPPGLQDAREEAAEATR